MLQQQPPPPPGPPDQLVALPGLGEEEEEEEAPALPPTPPWWRRRGTIIAIILLVILALGGLIYFFAIVRRMPPVIYQTQRVTPGTLTLTISATGPLQAGIFNVNFKNPPGTMATIATIPVHEGQAVKQGQIVATLDKVSLQDAVNQARRAYEAALTALSVDEANSGATFGLSGANVSAAQTALNNALVNLAEVEAQSRASVNAAQTALNNAEAQLAATEARGAADVATAQTALVNAEAQLATAEQEAQASAQLAQATATACAATATATPPVGSLALCNAQAQQAVGPTQTSLTQAQAAVNTAQANLNSAEAIANQNDTAAQAAVNTAQRGLTTAQRLANLNNATAQSQVNTAQRSLNTAQANGNLSDTSSQGLVSNAQKMVNTTLTSLQTAQDNLNNATLTAPHAGTVTVINGTVGGTPGVPKNASVLVTGGTTGTFMQIVDSSTLQAVASVNEADTANLKVGDTAQFTVNAYGTRIFTGHVSYISPNGQTVSNVVTFPVYVDVDKTDLRGATLLPNMTANLTIAVATRTNVLLVPVNAVNFARSATLPNAITGTPALITPRQAALATTRASQLLMQLLAQNPSIASDNPTPAFLLEQSGNTFITRPVVLGLTDGTIYEVLRGITAGETIIVGPRTPAIPSIPGGPGGGGPGGG